ncbi:MAG TPA: caspase family protein [Gemmataceae bacterium]|nr:caspase family protein [Gemmataceae bacterium]
MAKGPDWRSTDAGGGGARPWQSGDNAGEAPAKMSRRAIKRAVALFTLVGLAIGIGVVIALLRSQRPACLVLIGSGYEQNLFLPTNVHGWNGGLQLFSDNDISEPEDLGDKVRSLFSSILEQPHTMRRIAAPYEMKDQAWDETWSKIIKEINKGAEKENVVLYFSMHGYADDKEAYLLRNVPDMQSSDGFTQSRIPFKDVLKSLKDVDQNKTVVVLLDVVHAQSHWPIGMLQNDFAERIKSYEKDISALGNVTIICSAAPGQRSWESDDEQTTAFAHFVAQGLKGAAKKEFERVSVSELFEFVNKNVDTWAKVNRARRQTPIILGDQPAQRVELVRVVKSYEKPAAKARPLAAGEVQALTREWGTWKRLKQDQAPYVHSPQLWRLYQDTLLRYELLQRVSDPTGKAADLKKNLDSLAADIEAAKALPEAFGCVGNAFPVARVLGFRPKEAIGKNTLDDYWFQLKRGNDAEKNKLLEKFAGKSREDRQYWQLQISKAALTEAIGDPDFNRTTTRDQLVQLTTDLVAPQRSAEVHLVKMLGLLDPGLVKLDAKEDTVRQALRVRMLAEEVALCVPASDDAGELYAESIYQRIRKDLEKADAFRQEGEDALFGATKAHLDLARDRLGEAESAYKDVRRDAQQLRLALALRDEAAAELPYFAFALAALPGKDNPTRANLEARRLTTESLGDRLTELNKNLAQADAPVPDTARIAKDLKELRTDYQLICTTLATQEGKLQMNWHAMNSAVSVPPLDKVGDVKLRLTLLTKLRDLSAELNSKPPPDQQPDETDTNRLERQRTMLHATLKPFKGPIPSPDADVDDRVRDFYLKMPGEIKQAATTEDEKALAPAVEQCRTIPGALADPIRDKQARRVNPVDRLRRVRTAGLLGWLADRTLRDHWFEPEPKGDEDPTYYRPVAQAYLTAAAALVKDKAKIDVPLAGLTFAETPNAYWTTELTRTLNWHVKADRAVPEGTPMAWLEVLKGSVKKDVWQPRPREAITPWPAPKPANVSFEMKKYDFVESNDATVAFHTVYRGQHKVEKLVLHSPPPDVIVRQFPAPDKVRFAVRMDKALDYGAISIVLDNSASMKYVYPKQNPKEEDRPAKAGELSRFDFAYQALKQVLEKLPEGTQLSITTLGADNVTGAVELRRPSRWEQGSLDFWLTKIRLLPREFDSPIAKGIIRAMDKGFPVDFRGPKLVLVLSDGMDNYSFDETKKNPDGNTSAVVNALRRANERHPDTDVVVVCFIEKNEKGEYAEAKRQFEHVKEFTAKSGFFAEEDGRKLGSVIENIIRPHVQLKVNGKAVRGFENGRPVNYFSDDTLVRDPPVSPDDYKVNILHVSKPIFDLHLPGGDNLFALLKRKNERDFLLERGILGEQREIKGQYPSEARDGWLTTLLDFHMPIKAAEGKMRETVIFEKTELDNDIRQRHPGFVWLELDPVKGTRPTETLEWEKDWSMAAPAYRLLMPWPQGLQPKLSAWFWPESRPLFVGMDKLNVRRKIRIPFEPENADDPIESVRRERRTIGPDDVEKECVVIRMRYASRKPIFVSLNDYPNAGTEHRFFLGAGKATAYFYDLPPGLTDLNVVLTDIDAFKRAAAKVELTPDRDELVAPAIFRFGSR